VEPLGGRIAELKQKVIQAWDKHQPNWREELAAKQAKAKAEPKPRARPKSKKATVPKTSASTSKKSKNS
jgi:hypothetical protein